MPTISIMGHVERCPQNDQLKDGKPDLVYFTLNLSVGMIFTDAELTGAKPDEALKPDDVLKIVEPYVKPWMWKQTTKLRVAGIRKVDQADVAEEITTVTLEERPWPAAGDPLKAWHRQLENKFKSVTRDQHNAVIINPQTFRWPVVVAGKVNTVKVYDGDDPANHISKVENHSWTAELSDFSTQPAPLPYIANLSRAFWIPAKVLAPYDRITALGLIRFGKPDPDPERSPAWPAGGTAIPLQDPASVLKYLDGNGGPLVWSYAPVAKEYDINGYVNSAPVETKGDGWVTLDGAIYRQNWLAELEWRAADLFDLPGLLLKYLETLRKPDDPENKAFGAALEALTPLIKATLRDLVQTGLTCGSRVIPGGVPQSPKDDPVLEKELGLAGDMLRELARILLLMTDGRVSDDPPDRFRSNANLVLKLVKTWEQCPEWIRGWWYGWSEGHTDGVLQRLAGQPQGTQNIADAKEKAKTQLANYAVLNQWHSILSDEAKVRELIFDQWDAVLTERSRPKPDAEKVLDVTKTWWARYRSVLRERVMPALASRKRQQLMHLGVQWDQVITFDGAGGAKLRTTEDVKKTLTKNLAAVLTTYTKQRAFPGDGHVFDDLPQPDAAVPDGPVDEFLKWLREQYLPNVIDTAVLAGNDPAALEVAQQPDEIVVHVAPVTGGSAVVQEDHTRFGVLLRYRNDPNNQGQRGKARCVTLVNVAEPGKPDAPPFLQNTLRAVRPVYRNGVRGGLISYNNEPLSAKSPAIGLADQHELQARAAADMGEWLQFTNPYGNAKAEQPRLPGLQFGLDYDVAAFLVGVGGTLPRELCTHAHPTTYIDPPAPETLPWFNVKYRRRVAVGPVRLESGKRIAANPRLRNPGEMGDRLNLPPVPSSVYPLARSLDALSARTVLQQRRAANPDAKGPNGALVSQLAASAEDLSQSLILLVPQPRNDAERSHWIPAPVRDFTFSVRPPAVDVRVWDRSYLFVDEAQAPTTGQRKKSQRRMVWSQTFTQIDNPEALSGADMTLDDPVVSGVLVRLSGVYPPSANQTVQIPFPWTSDATAGVTSEQRAPRQIVVRSTSDAMPTLTAPLTPADPCTVDVPRGTVCRLELWAMIPDAALDQFPTGFAAKCNYESYQGYKLAAPRRFAIEVATDEMPEASDLLASVRARAVAGGTLGPIREAWTAQSVVFGPRRPGETLQLNWRTEVAIDPGQLENAQQAKLQWIHRVNVLVERWRWNGRPLHDAAEVDPTVDSVRPFSAATFFDAVAGREEDQLIGWDGFLFGDRDAGDYRIHESTVDFAERDPGKRAPSELPARVFHQDVTADVGALYFRYAVQVRSRYEGLFLDGPVDSRLGGAASGNRDQKEAWRRLIVPCRYDKDIPPPQVKLIVPLTDVRQAGKGHPNADVTPGLLVVLNEPWFLYGGLAEDLVVEVATAEEPVRPKKGDAPINEPLHLSELGPDAMYARNRVQTVVPPGAEFPAAYSFEPVVAYGPIGHTFDTDTLAPEFVHTSFIIPAPVLMPLDEDATTGARRDLSWYFIKFRFRRRIEPSGHHAGPRDPQSKATESSWAQFLPPSSLYYADRGGRRESISVSAMKLKKGGTGSDAPWWIVEATKPSEPLPLLPTPADATDSRSQLWALVTEQVFDAYGRLNQERFLDFCSLSKGTLQLHDAGGLSRAVRPRVRLVELQVLPHRKKKPRAELDEPDAEENWIENAPLYDENATRANISLAEYFFPRDRDMLTESRARWVRVSDAIDAVQA